MRTNPGPAAGRSRSARRAVLTAALAAVALGTSAGAALAAPAATVTPSTDLDPAAANPLTVSGRGFDDRLGTAGLYAVVTATVGGSLLYDAPSTQWIAPADAPPPGPGGSNATLEADGTFTATVAANRTFTSGATAVDCAVTQCYVSTIRAHGPFLLSTVLSQTPIVFRAGAASPSVTVTPSSGLSRDGDTTVTISGSGFDPNGNGGRGFYVTYGPKTPDYWQTSPVGAAKRISPGATPGPSADVLNPDGSFSTTLTISPVYMPRGAGEAVDCRTVSGCAVLTFASQGGTYRGFDTAAPLAFAPLTPHADVTPTTNLNRDGATTVTVRGSDYAGGTYVAVTAIVGGRVLTDDQANAKWVRPNGPTPDQTMSDLGAFETTVTVNPTFRSGDTTVDCRVTQCAVSTWRQHTNPTPDALWTSASLTFAAAPQPPPGDGGKPPVVTPKVAIYRRAQTLAKNGTAPIAVLTCPRGTCRVSAPRTVKAKIGRRYKLAVSAPRTVRAGKRAVLRVKLSRAARRALLGRSAWVRVRFAVTGTEKVITTARVKIKRAAASGKHPAAPKQRQRRS